MSKPVVAIKNCEVCGDKMPIYKYYGIKRFCSAKCRAKIIKMPDFTPFKKGFTPWNKGKKWPELSKQRKGEGNPAWKGDRVGYSQLHKWVNANKKRPLKCRRCGVRGKLHLANLSYQYKRELSDWIYLCIQCHIKKDRQSGDWGKATKVFNL